jgi:sacsin
MWDFVAHGENVEIRNQMRGFSAIMKEFDKPYNGTIIRIPLRTELQAEASEICKKPTTVSDVDAVLKNFASEFGTSGLLFMKNIERIEIEIGDNVAFTIKICNTEHVRRYVLHAIHSNIL